MHVCIARAAYDILFPHCPAVYYGKPYINGSVQQKVQKDLISLLTCCCSAVLRWLSNSLQLFTFALPFRFRAIILLPVFRINPHLIGYVANRIKGYRVFKKQNL